MDKHASPEDERLPTPPAKLSVDVIMAETHKKSVSILDRALPPSSPLPEPSPRRPPPPKRSSQGAPSPIGLGSKIPRLGSKPYLQAADPVSPLPSRQSPSEPPNLFQKRILRSPPLKKRKSKKDMSGTASTPVPSSYRDEMVSLAETSSDEEAPVVPKQILPRRPRRTLDEELRSVAPQLRPDDVNEFDRIINSGVYKGVGTAPKDRGFLAHGGVWLGEGYVEGVVHRNRYD